MTHPYTIDDLKRAEGLQILHPQFDSALRRLRHFHQLGKSGAAPRNLLVIGQSGTGKTTLLETFKAELSPEHTREHYRHPALYVRAPSSPTIRSLAEEMLIALGAGQQMRGTSTEKTNQLKTLIRNCETEILLLDEFHHFLFKGKRAVEDVTEWLKTLIDEIHKPVVLAGLPQAEEILHANEQLRRRFAAHITFSAFDLDSENNRELLRSVLHAMDTHINAGQPLWGLAQWERVRRMYYASDGLIGYIAKIVYGVLEIMIDLGSRQLEDWMLEAAFTQYIWNNGIERNNPFNPKFEFRRLNRRGEPFAETVFSQQPRSPLIMV